MKYVAYKLLILNVEGTINKLSLDEVIESFDNIGIRKSRLFSSSNSKYIRVNSRGIDKLV